jgi:hypothetical protein
MTREYGKTTTTMLVATRNRSGDAQPERSFFLVAVGSKGEITEIVAM